MCMSTRKEKFRNVVSDDRKGKCACIWGREGRDFHGTKKKTFDHVNARFGQKIDETIFYATTTKRLYSGASQHEVYRVRHDNNHRININTQDLDKQSQIDTIFACLIVEVGYCY